MIQHIVKNFIITLALFIFTSQTFAASKTSDINSVRFPEESWSGEILSAYNKIKPQYVPLDYPFIIPIFPANDSPQTQKELEALLNMAKKERTKEQIKEIKAEDGIKSLTKPFIDHKLLDPVTHPQTVRLLLAIEDDLFFFIVQEKLRFKRPRPTQLEPLLTTIIPIPPHAAYPSGHATQSHMIAKILSKLDPKHSSEYQTLANSIAHRREIAGVHYPSDSSAGQAFADQFVDVILKSPDLQDLIKAAQAEYKP